MLLITIERFDPNPKLININKLKPYRFVKDYTLQPIMIKPSDLLLEEPIETNDFGDFFIKELKLIY